MSFFRDLEGFGDRAALVDETGSACSYRDLAARADEMGRTVGSRRLVICLCENTAGSVAGYLGVLRAGSVSLMLAGATERDRLSRLIETYHPRYLWVPAAKADELAFGPVVHRTFDYALVELAGEPVVDLHPELALLLTTSGSTGSPVLVRQTVRNLAANSASIAESLGIRESDRPVTTLPMNYTYGLSILNSHLLRGCTIVLSVRSVTDRQFWKTVDQQAVTGFGGVPYTYETLRRFGFSFLKYGKLRMLTQAGGKLKHELVREFEAACRERGIAFVVMYGQTEATARMAYLPPERAVAKPGSIGVAIPGGRFWLEDDAGAEIAAANAIGELVYAGDNVTLGYARNAADLAKGDENNGVLRTGDLAFRDEDGFYFIAGRRKRFIKLFGNRVSLDEVEQFVGGFAYPCACVGVDDKLSVYITNPGLADDVKQKVARFLNVHPSAVDLRCRDALPRNDAGKIQYSLLTAG
jgi:acyl-coenzyme A synthetase/AMP-(fatty) acid ligase